MNAIACRPSVVARSAAVLCAVALLPAASAQSPSGAPASRQQPSALVADGGRIASQGAPGAAACSSCHGPQGEGNGQAGFPRIGGQSAEYLANQLQAYADGRRTNPVMTPIAKALGDAQRRAVARWYEQQPRASQAAASPAVQPAASGGNAVNASGSGPERGRLLAGVGDESKQVQACANCHGPNGAGEGEAYPFLAGQHAGYLVAALGEWKSGARNTDPSGQMPSIARALGDADVRALAEYYARQPLAERPSNRDASTMQAAAGANASGSSAGRTIVSGPRDGGGQKEQGTGSEPGTPTTGGATGPGGGSANRGSQPDSGRGRPPR